jgi:Holliday junction DNA helicase RuvA
MIARIEGTLVAVEGETALIHAEGGLSYEVLLPAFTVPRLAAHTHQSVTLHTLQFLESQNQGATFLPRLAGFLTAQDKAFYELLVTAKGIGYRRALRAMTLSSAQIAAAIADRDIATLQTLPEIGKRTAENLTVNLRDKVERFAADHADAGPTASQPATSQPSEPATAGPADAASPAAANGTPSDPPRPSQLAKEAVEALVQLGEHRSEATQWVDRVLTAEDPPQTSEAILTEVYRLKASSR